MEWRLDTVTTRGDGSQHARLQLIEEITEEPNPNATAGEYGSADNPHVSEHVRGTIDLDVPAGTFTLEPGAYSVSLSKLTA